MNFRVETDTFLDLIANICPALPISFAVWRLGGDEVFISDKLCTTLSINQNIIDAYSFVKSMHEVFGSFLNVAVEKIERGRKEYSSSATMSQNDEVLLNLKFYAEKKIYVFTTTKETGTKGSVSSKTTTNETNCFELDKILDILPIYVWQKDRNLQITYCNEAYAKALEASKEYVLSNNVKLISASRRGVYIDQSLYSTKPKKSTEHVIINGSRRLLSIEETPFSKGGKSTGIAIDITDREELEINFRNYKKHTEEVLDNISVPIAIFDANTTLVFANQAIIKMFSVEGVDIYNKYKFSDILNHMLSNDSIIDSADILKYKEKAAELFQEVIEPRCTMIHLRNGDVLSVTITPNHGGGLVFMFEDITDKIRLERRVNSISSIYEETLDALSEGAIIFGSDSKIRVMNQAAAKLWNKDKLENYIGEFFQNSAHLLAPESKIRLLNSNLLAMISERVKFSEKLEFLSGEIICCEYIPLLGGMNIVKFVDISDKFKLTKAIEEKKLVTEQIDKLKSNLISNISGEMHASIQTITGFAEILCNKYFGELSEKQMAYCSGIANAVKDLNNIIDAVISLARMEAGQMRFTYAEAKLLDIVQTAISVASDKVKNQNISITTNFEDPEFAVYLNKEGITKALFYLIFRATQEVSPEGNIEVLVKINDSQGDFEIVIKDDGEILPYDELEKIQERLANDSQYADLEYTLDFGLAFANGVINAHKGTLSIQSDENTGNVITCTLPIGCFA